MKHLSSLFTLGWPSTAGLGGEICRYGLAVVCVGLALVLRSALDPILGMRQPFATFYAAIAVATVWGGMRAAFAALFLGYVVGDWLFIPPAHTLNLLSGRLPDVIEGAIHLGVGTSIIMVIAQAQEAQARARAQRELLEAVLQQMPAGVVVVEAPSGRQILRNEQAGKIWERSFNSGHSANPHAPQAFHSDGRPYETREWPLARSLASGERVRDEEIAFFRRDGTKGTMIVNSAPVRDAKGSIILAVKSFQDVTEQKRHQEVQARLAAIVESSDDGILSLETDGTIRTWNRGAERIFGYSSGEIIGKSESLLVPVEGLAEEDQLLEKLNQGEHIYRFEAERKRKDGQLIHVSLTISPLQDQTGRVTGISSIARDITERKKIERALRVAERKLRNHAQALEKEVAVRTAEMRETIESLEAICYHIAHDLRAPLRTMEGFSSMIMQSQSATLSDETKDLLRRIAISATRMDGLIRDLLEYGRVGHMAIPCGGVDLDEILETVLGGISAQIETKRAHIEITRPLPKVCANRTLLRQILENLLCNALEYVAPGVTPHIQIWTEESPTTCNIFVQDNGIGIEPQHHDRIFKVFERLQSQAHYPGTGIGLAIVHKAVQRMGGQVSLRSELGQGSRFCIALPQRGMTTPELEFKAKCA